MLYVDMPICAYIGGWWGDKASGQPSRRCAAQGRTRGSGDTAAEIRKGKVHGQAVAAQVAGVGGEGRGDTGKCFCRRREGGKPSLLACICGTIVQIHATHMYEHVASMLEKQTVLLLRMEGNVPSHHAIALEVAALQQARRLLKSAHEQPNGQLIASYVYKHPAASKESTSTASSEGRSIQVGRRDSRSVNNN